MKKDFLSIWIVIIVVLFLLSMNLYLIFLLLQGWNNSLVVMFITVMLVLFIPFSGIAMYVIIDTYKYERCDRLKYQVEKLQEKIKKIAEKQAQKYEVSK